MSVEIALFALGVLATTRLTRLVAQDTITARHRERLKKRTGRLAAFATKLISCPWCLSIWTAALIFAGLTAAYAYSTGLIFWPLVAYPLEVLAASQLAALITLWLDPGDYAMAPPRHQVVLKGEE